MKGQKNGRLHRAIQAISIAGLILFVLGCIYKSPRGVLGAIVIEVAARVFEKEFVK